MLFNASLLAFLSLLLTKGVSARTQSEIYDELVDVLKEIQELEKNTEIEEGKRGSVTKRKYDDIKQALADAENNLASYNELNRFYYFRGGNFDAFQTPASKTAGKDYAYTLLDSPNCAAGEVKSVIFEVRACSDAHVGLKVDDSDDGDMYEIVIGADRNTAVKIRKQIKGTKKETATRDIKYPVDCTEYRTFMVGWAGGHIQVFGSRTRSGWRQLLDWQDRNPDLEVNFVGLTTAGFTEGYFRTPKRGNDVTIDTPRQFNSVSYTLLQNNGFPLVQYPYLMFEVMTCNDAHIALFEEQDEDADSALQIILGTDINDRSVIRVDDDEKAESDLDNVVSCDEYRAFFVSWQGGHTQVFRQTGKGWETLMSFSEGNERPIQYVGFTTGLFAGGSWRFSKTFEKGLDMPAGDTCPETMAGLNNMDTAKTEIEQEEQAAILSLEATKLILDRKIFPDLKELQTSKEALSLWSDKFDKCVNYGLVSVDCSDAMDYRTINGECNNLNHPHWGAAATTQIRLLPADYDDGLNAPRTKDTNGNILPSARFLSTEVFLDSSDPDTPDDTVRSLMMMVWGQFIDHDVGETPISKGYNSVTVQCCGIIDPFIRGGRAQCFSIPIPAADPSFTHDCMNFVRSTAARGHPCIPGVREQLNAITSYIDGSMIYGSEHEVAEDLRAHYGGRMKVASNNTLPENDDSTCVRDLSSAHCFFAGDIRVNENPLLSSMHTVWVRYHNILADRIHAEQPGWSDDDIYYVTRQIIGALIQSITYSRWLPNVLGPTIMDDYQLNLYDPHIYDDTLNGGISLAFTTAGLRYGHTLIRDTVDRFAEDGTIAHSDNLEDVFFVTDPVFEDIEGIGRSMFLRPCKESDGRFVSAIDHLLFSNNNPVGFDLTALNIQRGRDHGLPGYIEYLDHCGFGRPATFSDLPFHNATVQSDLQAAYAGSGVDAIDLFVGGMSENSLADGEIGPTFACILGEQFHRLRFGDRFFYQHDLTDAQIANVEQVELSKVLCEVFDYSEIQENAFILTDQRSLCSDLDDIDVTLWTDQSLSVETADSFTAVKQPIT